MQNKTVLITGATNGIGKVAARECAQMGAHVIVAGRNPTKCDAVVKEIREATKSERAEAMIADLSSMAEVRKLAAEVKQKHERLDVLLNNAGAWFDERIETVDGYEQTLALNHLNYFLLTHELLDLLKDTASVHGEARIVNVASDAHKAGKPGPLLADPQMKKSYSSIKRYGETKLANIMFTYALHRRLEGTKVTVNALHPGFVATSFGHETTKGFLNWATRMSQKLFALTEEQGAATSIFLASSPDVAGVSGNYYHKKKTTKSSKASYDEAAQEQLWTLSEELVGIDSAA